MSKGTFWPVVLACTMAGFGVIGVAGALLQAPQAARPQRPAEAAKAAPVVAAPAPVVPGPAAPVSEPAAPPVPAVAPAIVMVSYDVFDAHDARARRAPDWMAALDAMLNATPAEQEPPQSARKVPQKPNRHTEHVAQAPAAASTAAVAAPVVSRPVTSEAARVEAGQPAAAVSFREDAVQIKPGASRFALVHVTATRAWVRVDGMRTVQVSIGETVPGLGALQELGAGTARFANGLLSLGETTGANSQ
jgi:DNA-directed RNA polymerase subunit K/omega